MNTELENDQLEHVSGHSPDPMASIMKARELRAAWMASALQTLRDRLVASLRRTFKPVRGRRVAHG